MLPWRPGHAFLNLTPLKQKLLQAFRDSSVQRSAARQWTVAPPEKRRSPPAIFLEDDLALVTEVMEDTSREHETRRIRGGMIEHSATLAYEFRRAEILDGMVYHGAMKYALCVDRKDRWIGPAVTDVVQDAALACTLYGSRYFGHWMTDDLSAHLLAETVATPVTAARTPYAHEPGYCEIFRIQRREVERTKCERLIIFDDVGQNSHKRARYETLRSGLRRLGGSRTNHRVWIRRGFTGAARRLVNADEIEQYLSSQGVVIVDPEKLTPREMAREIVGARIVIGVEGSHLSNGLFALADGGAMCALQPPYRFNNVYKDYTDCLEMRYSFVVGKEVESGFHVDLDRLKKVLDKSESPAPA